MAASLPSYRSRRKRKRKRSKISSVNSDGTGDFENNNITTVAALPDEILIQIINKLDLLEFHRVGAVSRLWRQSLFKRQFLKPQFPWLMLSFSESKRNLDHQGFYSAFYGKVYRLETPQVRGVRCCGSNWGWLIMLGAVEGCMFLYNPFTRVSIELPPKYTLPLTRPYSYHEEAQSRNYIRKAMLLSPAAATNNFNLRENKVVSSMATTDDCLIVALFLSRHLTFCRPWDDKWTPSTVEYIRPSDGIGIEDFIVYDGKLYAIRQNYDLVLLQLLPRIRETSCKIAPPADDTINPNPNYHDHERVLYLVESRGELLMVIRRIKSDDSPPPTADMDYDSHSDPDNIEYDSPTTNMFWIFRLDRRNRRWVKVEDLGDQMLFVGTNTGFSISSLHYHGFRGNSIYFTDDYFHSGAAMMAKLRTCDDLGVFHLEDNSIEFNFYPTYSHSYASPPIWFAPIAW